MLEGTGNRDGVRTGDGSGDEGHPSVGSSLAALLGLVGVAIVVGVVDLLLQDQSPSWGAALASWSWVVDVVLVSVAVAIAVTVIRFVFRGIGVPSHSRRHDHGRYRSDSRGPLTDRDPAVEIARERYGRGEISQDQLDQTLRQLGRAN